MRSFIDIVTTLLCEDFPRRETDPEALAWINAALARPDAKELYLHGTNAVFDHFVDPDTSIGRLIFSSKLIEPFSRRGPNEALQAEYYGRNLLLLKVRPTKPFNPNPKADPVAHKILADAVAECWDADNKIRYGRFDYQDAHLVVPAAVAAGYDFFRVFEQSIMGDSYGSAYASMIEIVDRYPS